MIGEFPVTHILAELGRDDLLPAILFRTARKQCDADVLKVGRSRRAILPPEMQAVLRQETQRVIEKYRIEPVVIETHPHYEPLITTGVGAHHAGQLLVWRLLLEELMSRGLLRLMIATGTVAAGVDFPARTVVVTAHSKRGSEGFDVLTSSEFQQMAGRAGRRGKDAVGICVIAPGRFSDARVFHQVSHRPPEPLRSAYYAAPSTMLNLLKYRTVDDLRFLVAKSLASYLDRKSAHAIREEAVGEEFSAETNTDLHGEAKKKAMKRARRKIKEADVLEQRQEQLLNASLEGLEKLGYVEKGSLTDKGMWAANLCTSLVLELSEAIHDGLFNDLTVEELAGLVASIAGDPHRPYFSLKANPLKKEYFLNLEQILTRVRDNYRGPGSSSEAKVLPDAALTVLTWMDAADWPSFAGLLRLNGIAEGDVARLVSQTADHLNQISRLHETHPVLAAAAEEARARLLRPPLTETIAADAT